VCLCDGTLRAMISGVLPSACITFGTKYDESAALLRVIQMDTSVRPGSCRFQITSQRTLRCSLYVNIALQNASSEIETMQVHANLVQMVEVP
jgi:hypothetical protein